MALQLRRPLFLEGEAGVGKTELAKVLATGLGCELIRLQCYEGLDLSSALYEWDYPAQILESQSKGTGKIDLYDERFLLERPLLRALRGPWSVLLIDEIDRADAPFEAFLLELLSDYQVTIPELGTVKASREPLVVITSNRTREVHDALKRRCLYHWVDTPDAQRELEILRVRLPGCEARLAEQVVSFVQALRSGELYKPPGVAETLDWTRALLALDRLELDTQSVNDTLGALLKYKDDLAAVRGDVAGRLVAQALDP